ncbi:hypothetical protein METP3_03039 [Methanosarcinales archaeon]|nr:hypothetical protein METP3_03039 [Methanosarcinales archaeon]
MKKFYDFIPDSYVREILDNLEKGEKLNFKYRKKCFFIKREE